MDNLHGEFRCCPLYKTRTNIVWMRGTSSKNVDVLFVGEAPGKDEDLRGIPFVGRAGRKLDEWIKEANIENYAIINIVKCRPPYNRKPYQSEIRVCLSYFIKQIYDLNPKLIVALGAIPSSVLIHRKEVITNIGKVFKSRFGPVIVFPHPAFIIRGFGTYVPIKELRETLDKIKNEKIKNEKIENEKIENEKIENEKIENESLKTKENNSDNIDVIR